jgi:RNA polymerase sigma-70 factor (ECF subfamily)
LRWENRKRHIVPVTSSAAQHIEPEDAGRFADELRLAERVRAGDADALAELYARYRPALVALAEGYLDNAADADDIVQDLFLMIWRDRAQFVIEQSVAAYLFVAVRNHATNLGRLARRRRRLVPRRHDEMVFNSGETRITGPELVRAIERVVNRLPERCRLIYRMHRDGRCSYDDIATALGISPHTVRLQLIKAWDLLEARLTAAGWANVLKRAR